MAREFLISGEPMPLAPVVDDPELDAFHRKLLDYLRRLTTKLSNTEFGGTGAGGIETFAAAIDGVQAVAAAWTDVDWDDPLRMDSYYSHDAAGANPEQITLLQEGLYLAHFDAYTEEQEEFKTRLVTIIGGVTFILDYGETYKDTPAGHDQTLSASIPFYSAANGIIVAQAYSENAQPLQPARTRITILYLGTLAGTGGVPGNDPEDDPWWKYTEE